ncbi:MAG TPA: TolC family protein [Gemmatimonadales bacterium]|nr:TolC family protein [Gemmatimonadales bacterium]
MYATSADQRLAVVGVLVLLLALPPTGARAQRSDTVAAPVSLTRREAIERALARNPQLVAARERAAQARARRVQALAITDPTLTAVRDQHADYPQTTTTVAAAVTVPFPDKLRLRYDVAQADVRSFDAGYAALRQQIAAQTAAEYDTLLVALRHRSDLRESRSLAEEFFKKTDARFKAGDVAKLDVIKAQVDLAQAENALIANERDIATAEASLNRFLGEPVGTPLAPSDTLAVPPPLPELSTLVPLALSARPDLRSAESQVAGARAATALARESWLPDFFASAVHDNTQSLSPQYSFGLTMAVPIFFWQHTAGDIAEASHRTAELVAAAADTRAAVEQDVRSTYATARTALRQVTFIRDQLLPSAREAYRVASASYALGGSSALEVLDARRSLLDAQSAFADALSLANASRADLERAVGAPLEVPSP